MDELQERICARYDTIMYADLIDQYYGNSDFFNYGYWEDSVKDAKVASETLIEKLLDFLSSKEGRILDVACGKGGTAKYIQKYYEPHLITGVNISEKQILTCRQNVPEATFLVMDACNLEFADDSFENILCVESAFHFTDRQKFIEEAFRVLKPGGSLSMSDILLNAWGESHNELRPKTRGCGTLEEYRDNFLKAGFAQVEVVDATLPCWITLSRISALTAYKAFKEGNLEADLFHQFAENLVRRLGTTEYYVLVGATKGPA